MQAIFGTAAGPLKDGVLIVAVGAAFFALLETEKRIRLALRERRDPLGERRTAWRVW
jgi:hypothetical protein